MAPRNVSVLVAADDADIRDALADLLENDGYAVAVANGSRLPALLEELVPDLLLLDGTIVARDPAALRDALLNSAGAPLRTTLFGAIPETHEHLGAVRVDALLKRPFLYADLRRVLETLGIRKRDHLPAGSDA